MIAIRKKKITVKRDDRLQFTKNQERNAVNIPYESTIQFLKKRIHAFFPTNESPESHAKGFSLLTNVCGIKMKPPIMQKEDFAYLFGKVSLNVIL